MKESFREKKFTGDIRIRYTTELENGMRIKKTWLADQKELIGQILRIVDKYLEKDIKLTLRQLYYQLVSAELIPNALEVYKRIGILVSDMRYVGYLDWDAMEDRARTQEKHAEWRNLQGLIETAKNEYRLRRWDDQKYYVELLTEKEALYSVLEPITDKYHIRLCVNKGYTSSSVIYELYKRIEKVMFDKKVIILYVGDHDPSGLDMVRDIRDRLKKIPKRLDFF
jgi:hypothetical protein